MVALFQHSLHRSLRNLPMTLSVQIGLIVLVTLLVSAPLYLTALEDIGLRGTLADAPLDQRGIKATVLASQLQQAEYTRLGQLIEQGAQEAAWLEPTMLSATSSRTLLLPGGYTQGEVSFVDADAVLTNLRVLEGRLPSTSTSGAAIEVVLGTAAADALSLRPGDTLPLTDRTGGDPVITVEVVGLVEVADPTTPFWQSNLLALEPTVSTTRREGVLVVAPGVLWTQIMPNLPPGRASGQYRWQVVFDVTKVDQTNVLRAEADINRAVQATQGVLNSKSVTSNFGRIVEEYHQRFAIARAPLLLLFVEIAGLALIFIAWTAAFQAESTANEQAVLHARGASISQIVAVTGGQVVLLAIPAALIGIPFALLLLHWTAQVGPLAILTRVQALRLVVTPEARTYAFAAALVGAIVLALPAIPAARRSITALRQQTSRPSAVPFWQRFYLDLLVVIIAAVGLLQLNQQGGLLQQLRGRFAFDPFLVVAPFLMLVSGALIFLRVYPWLLRQTQRLTHGLRGLSLSLALVQLTRNRAASLRLVLLLSLTTALGLFTQTFGANLALNVRQRAGYAVGAEARATLLTSQPLLPSGLPAGLNSTWALRDTIETPSQRGVPVSLLAFDPVRMADVVFNPPDAPVPALSPLLDALGPSTPPSGMALQGQPRQLTLTLDRQEAPYDPYVTVSDGSGSFHRFRFIAPPAVETEETEETEEAKDTTETFTATLDLQPAAFPIQLVAIGLLSTDRPFWAPEEASKPAITVTLVSLAVDGTVVEQWDTAGTPWKASPDTAVDAQNPTAGAVSLDGNTVTITRGRTMRAIVLQPNPQEQQPIPVAIDTQFAAANNLTPGSTSLMHMRGHTVPIRVVAIVERFPTLGLDAKPFVIVHGPDLVQFTNSTFAPLVVPNEVWLDLPDDPETLDLLRQTSGIGTIRLQSDVLRSLSRDPLAVGIAGVFFLGFVSSMGLTVLGFTLALYLAGQRRSVEFAILQALGLSRRDMLKLLAIEQMILVGLALLAGTAIGVALVQLILPFMTIGDGGRAVVPPSLFIVPWRTLVLTYATLITLFIGLMSFVLWLLFRRNVSNVLRIGEA